MSGSKKVRILIDALGADQAGGARTHTLCLFQEVFRLRPDWQFLILLSQKEAAFAAFPQVKQILLPWRKGPAARLALQFLMPFIAYRHRVNLIHFIKSQGAWVPGIAGVLTIHDATTLRLPEFHSRLAVWYWRRIMPALARSMQAITTVSHHAAGEIQELLGVPAERIHVIYNAGQFNEPSPISAAAFEKMRSRFQLPERYLLFIGILALKKNLATLVRAMALLQQEMPNPPPLVIVGPPYHLSEDRAVFDLIKELKLEAQVRYLGELPSEELHAILTHAELLALPAIHEGFGIPAIEAMACGVPVIASRASALPEIINSAGILISDYLSPAAWAEAIEALLSQPEKKKMLIQNGLERATAFRWEYSAQELVAIYQRLIAK